MEGSGIIIQLWTKELAWSGVMLNRFTKSLMVYLWFVSSLTNQYSRYPWLTYVIYFSRSSLDHLYVLGTCTASGSLLTHPKSDIVTSLCANLRCVLEHFILLAVYRSRNHYYLVSIITIMEKIHKTSFILISNSSPEHSPSLTKNSVLMSPCLKL
jgi:hypothetical protein